MNNIVAAVDDKGSENSASGQFFNTMTNSGVQDLKLSTLPCENDEDFASVDFDRRIMIPQLRDNSLSKFVFLRRGSFLTKGKRMPY